jgi:hypothetical protein
MTLVRSATALTVALLVSPPVFVQAGLAQTPTPASLGSASIEDLMNIQVFSVSRKEQERSQAAAAIYVISQEDNAVPAIVIGRHHVDCAEAGLQIPRAGDRPHTADLDAVVILTGSRG